MEEPTPYVRAALGTNALKRLGASIATGGPRADEQHLYRAFIADADRRRVYVQKAADHLLASAAEPLPRTSVTATGRTKTLATLREKLIRSPHEKLPGVRDVAGVRIVADCSLLEQNVITKLLGKALSDEGPYSSLGFTGTPQIVDRLADPMHGYRAIHLVVRLDGAPVEIQIRTELQHSWAALMELLCDRWGREPRYGSPVVEPHPEVKALKERVLEEMQQLSREIAEHETSAAPYGVANINIDWSEPLAGISPARIQAIISEHQRIEPALSAAQRDVRESLTRLRATIAEIDRQSGEIRQ